MYREESFRILITPHPYTKTALGCCGLKMKYESCYEILVVVFRFIQSSSRTPGFDNILEYIPLGGVYIYKTSLKRVYGG